MEQFTMVLNDSFQRPIVYLSNWHGLNALLDTGALFPVWTASEKALVALGGKLFFPELAIVSCSDLRDVPYHIVLSATMFRDLIYEVDDKNHKFNVTIPDDESNIRNLRMEDSDGKLHICNMSTIKNSTPALAK